MRVVVPPSQAPGVGGAPPTTFAKKIDLCDLYSTSKEAPETWVTIQIGPAPDHSVMPDANGNFLHLLIEFPAPAAKYGKRNEIVHGFAPTGSAEIDAVQIETDPGTYLFGCAGSAKLVGGRPGDIYEVAAWAQAVRRFSDDDLRRANRSGSVDLMEPPSNTYALTFNLPAPGAPTAFPPIPQYHSHIWAVEGSLIVAGVTLNAVYGNGRKVPAQGTIQYSAGGIYQTGSSL